MLRLIFISAGVILIAFGFRAYIHSQKTLDWLSTDGEVTYFDVLYAGEGRYSSAYKFKPEIRYKYKVERKAYIGSKIYIDNAVVWTKDIIIKNLTGYNKGAIVRVYYDPNDPQVSVLKRNISYEKVYFFILLGVVVLVIGIFANYAFNKFISIIARIAHNKKGT